MNDIDLNKNSYCLTIDDNRYEFLCNRFKKVGLNPPKKYSGFVACGQMNYVRSNLYGQISIIQHAKQLNLPYVIVFEDDAFPRNDITDEFQKILHDLINRDIDVLYLGRNGDAALWNKKIESLHPNPIEFKNAMSNPIKISDYLSTIEKNVFGNHSYIVFEKAYDFIIKYMMNCLISNPLCYADIFLSSIKELKILHITDPLFVQYNMKTNEITHMCDYDNHRGYGKIEHISKFNNDKFKL